MPVTDTHAPTTRMLAQGEPGPDTHAAHTDSNATGGNITGAPAQCAPPGAHGAPAHKVTYLVVPAEEWARVLELVDALLPLVPQLAGFATMGEQMSKGGMAGILGMFTGGK